MVYHYVNSRTAGMKLIKFYTRGSYTTNAPQMLGCVYCYLCT
jgi:hypothetical protein